MRYSSASGAICSTAYRRGLTRASPHVQITDNYITGTRLRVRKVREPQTNKWTVKFTQKFAPNPVDLSRAIITNIYLTAAESEVLSVFEGNEIRKNRYPHEFADRKFSIDMSSATCLA